MRKKLFQILMALPLLLLAACGHKAETPAFYEEVRNVNKLVVARMAVQKMATIDDIKLQEAQGTKQQLAAIVDALKVGDRVAAYSYNTFLRAYIDMTHLQPEDVSVDEQSKIVNIKLPAVQVEIEGREAALKEEHYRVTGLRSKINPRERAQLKEQMNTMVKDEIEKISGFRDALAEQGRKKAADYFTSLVASKGYKASITFKD